MLPNYTHHAQSPKSSVHKIQGKTIEQTLKSYPINHFCRNMAPVSHLWGARWPIIFQWRTINTVYSIVAKYDDAISNNITFWVRNDHKSHIRPFAANGTALGWCGQWVSWKLVQFIETRPCNLLLRCQRVQVSPGHDPVISPGNDFSVDILRDITKIYVAFCSAFRTFLSIRRFWWRIW
jgi:hypothetical protein